MQGQAQPVTAVDEQTARRWRVSPTSERTPSTAVVNQDRDPTLQQSRFCSLLLSCSISHIFLCSRVPRVARPSVLTQPGPTPPPPLVPLPQRPSSAAEQKRSSASSLPGWWRRSPRGQQRPSQTSASLPRLRTLSSSGEHCCWCPTFLLPPLACVSVASLPAARAPTLVYRHSSSPAWDLLLLLVATGNPQ